LEITYPARALRAGVEGWVEIGFTVNPDGSVDNVKVLNANPPRTFEQAAIKALAECAINP